MAIVDIPKVGQVDFPDTMSAEEINTAAKRLYDEANAPSWQDAQGIPESETAPQPPGFLAGVGKSFVDVVDAAKYAIGGEESDKALEAERMANKAVWEQGKEAANAPWWMPTAAGTGEVVGDLAIDAGLLAGAGLATASAGALGIKQAPRLATAAKAGVEKLSKTFLGRTALGSGAAATAGQFRPVEGEQGRLQKLAMDALAGAGGAVVGEGVVRVGGKAVKSIVSRFDKPVTAIPSDFRQAANTFLESHGLRSLDDFSPNIQDDILDQYVQQVKAGQTNPEALARWALAKEHKAKFTTAQILQNRDLDSIDEATRKAINSEAADMMLKVKNEQLDNTARIFSERLSASLDPSNPSNAEVAVKVGEATKKTLDTYKKFAQDEYDRITKMWEPAIEAEEKAGEVAVEAAKRGAKIVSIPWGERTFANRMNNIIKNDRETRIALQEGNPEIKQIAEQLSGYMPVFLENVKNIDELGLPPEKLKGLRIDQALSYLQFIRQIGRDADPKAQRLIGKIEEGFKQDLESTWGKNTFVEADKLYSAYMRAGEDKIASMVMKAEGNTEPYAKLYTAIKNGDAEVVGNFINMMKAVDFQGQRLPQEVILENQQVLKDVKTQILNEILTEIQGAGTQKQASKLTAAINAMEKKNGTFQMLFDDEERKILKEAAFLAKLPQVPDAARNPSGSAWSYAALASKFRRLPFVGGVIEDLERASAEKARMKATGEAVQGLSYSPTLRQAIDARKAAKQAAGGSVVGGMVGQSIADDRAKPTR